MSRGRHAVADRRAVLRASGCPGRTGPTSSPRTPRARSGSAGACSTAPASRSPTRWSRPGRPIPTAASTIPTTRAAACRASAASGAARPTRRGAGRSSRSSPGRCRRPAAACRRRTSRSRSSRRGLLHRVVTRIYFGDEAEANAADPVLAALGDAERATLIAATAAAGYAIDFHLQGARRDRVLRDLRWTSGSNGSRPCSRRSSPGNAFQRRRLGDVRPRDWDDLATLPLYDQGGAARRPGGAPAVRHEPDASRSIATRTCTRPAAARARRCACSTPRRTGRGGAASSGACSRRPGSAPGDRVALAYSFGPYIQFWASYEGAQEAGALVIPLGGMDSVQRLETMREYGATALLCTPSYALHLARVALDNGLGDALDDGRARGLHGRARRLDAGRPRADREPSGARAATTTPARRRSARSPIRAPPTAACTCSRTSSSARSSTPRPARRWRTARPASSSSPRWRGPASR